MNKPAAKEPSMDEILSSIRQIIADDDAEAAPDAEPVESQVPEDESAGGAEDAGLPSFDAFLAEEGVEDASESEPDPEAKLEPEPEPVPQPEPEPLTDFPAVAEEGDDALALSLDQVVDDEPSEPDDGDIAAEGDFTLPDDVAFVASEAPEPQAPEPARLGTMPDPSLSDDMAEHLLDSTTQAAARDAFSRLGGMSFSGGLTVEGVVREMLRPMLKSWLDENLPSIVERLVEREIERVSRGGR